MHRRDVYAVLHANATRSAQTHPDLEFHCAAGLMLVTGPALPTARRARAEAMLFRQRVLEDLLIRGDVLPGQPGADLAADESKPFLEANSAVLNAALSEFAGCVQHQVIVRWDARAALERFAATAELSAALQGPRPRPAAIAEAAEAIKARTAAGFAETMQPHVRQFQRLPTDGPDMVLNAVTCGARDTRQLEAALEEIDASWPEGLRISLIGPLPPANFGSLRIERPSKTEIERARQLLAITAGNDVTPNRIRDAFRNAVRERAPEGGHVAGGSIVAARDLLLDVAALHAVFPDEPIIARVQRPDASQPTPGRGEIAA